MKIVFICTNYAMHQDGIGHYTYNLHNEMKKNSLLDFKVITGKTVDKRGMEKLKSKVMINNIEDFIVRNYNYIDESTYFIIEYPFLEWNPFVLAKIRKLRRICNIKNAKIVLSIHEYKRVSTLRRKFIDLLIKESDGIMVTDEETKKNIKRYRKPILIRNIPSNINRVENNFEKENSFCFFGLINKSKDFDIMIDAWKKFNYKDYKLNIYTSSKTNIDSAEKYNINIYENLNDEELSKELWKSKFAILPIKPNISMNNGTLKAVAQHKCIPIGIFGDKELADLGINIDADLYTKENVLKSLQESININREIYEKKIRRLYEFGNKFSFENNSNTIYEFLNKI